MMEKELYTSPELEVLRLSFGENEDKTMNDVITTSNPGVWDPDVWEDDPFDS